MCDSSTVVAATLKVPLQLLGVGHGQEIWDESGHIQPAEIAFGPVQGAVMDDLRMGRSASQGNGPLALSAIR
jgi:hypothetical protein